LFLQTARLEADYEMGFPEDADMKPLVESYVPLEAFF
jgi:hypothetical protein